MSDSRSFRQAVVRLGLLIASALLLSSLASGQPSTDLHWSFQANGNMQAISVLPDLDGDGGPDIVFEGYENGPTGANHVFCIRGASVGAGQALWAARPIGGVSSGGGWGDNCIRTGPDLNGDGFPEVLLGTAWGGRTAFALNGTTGATFWSFDTYAHYGSGDSGWIYAMDSLGSDLTGDGVPEIVFCSGSFNDRVHCVNGATGALIWPYYGQDAFFDVLSCRDINNDGVRDVIAALGDADVSRRVIALSGTNGALLWQRNVQGALWNLAFIGDLTGDGVDEIVPAQWGSNLYCINGRTGATVWVTPHAAQQRVAALDDVNGDGVKDIAIGFNTTVGCRVVSGATGTTIWNTPTSDWAWAVDRIGDCTGDGINDVAVGDFDGYVYLMNGVTGQILWRWLNPTGDKIKTIRGVPDLNGNGVPDVVAGTQLLTNGTGGDVYALEGNIDVTSVPGGAVAVSDLRVSETYPNPSAATVAWSVAAAGASPVRLQIFSSDGRRIRDLGEATVRDPRSVPLSWDGRDENGERVPAGVYLARILARGRAAAERRVVLVR